MNDLLVLPDEGDDCVIARNEGTALTEIKRMMLMMDRSSPIAELRSWRQIQSHAGN